MNKYSVMAIRIFLFLVVGYVLYLYYPFAYRIFANLINSEWPNSYGSFAAGHYSIGKQNHSSGFLRDVFLLGSFVVAFFALPGVFVFYLWQLTKRLKIDPTPSRKSNRGSYKKMDHNIAGFDEKLLLNAYNQLQHIEAAIDTKLTTIKEDIITELREELRNMFDRKAEAGQCLDKARSLYKSEQYEKALGECNSAVELSPSGVAHFIRGVIHQKLSLDEAAIDDLKTAAKLGYQKAQNFLTAKGVSYQ